MGVSSVQARALARCCFTLIHLKVAGDNGLEPEEPSTAEVVLLCVLCFHDSFAACDLSSNCFLRAWEGCNAFPAGAANAR